MKVWKNGGFGRRVGGILERPFLDQNVTKMTEVGVLRIFLENDRLWALPVKTDTPLSPESTFVRKYESTTSPSRRAYCTKVSFITFESKFYFRTKVFYVHVQYVYCTVQYFRKYSIFVRKYFRKTYLTIYTFVRKYNVVLSYKVRKYESTFVRIVPYFEDRYEGNSCTRSPTGRVQLYTYAYVRVT